MHALILALLLTLSPVQAPSIPVDCLHPTEENAYDCDPALEAMWQADKAELDKFIEREFK